jgi:hypothetical protein
VAIEAVLQIVQYTWGTFHNAKCGRLLIEGKLGDKDDIDDRPLYNK